MTTIAFDGKTLAADRGCAVDELFVDTFKLQVFKPGEIVRLGYPKSHSCWAHTGSAAFRVAVIHWLINEAAPHPVPAEGESIDDCIGLWATPGGCYMFFARLNLMPVRGLFQAEGRGKSFAMGAMAAGASAEEAIRLASIYTDAAAHGVDTWVAPA